jgi:hypothetical protein
MRRGKRPKRKQDHPPRPGDPADLPDHAYAICDQRRIWVVRDGEEFLEAGGPVGELTGLGLFPTRSAARAMIMEIVHAPGWEHRNEHAAHYFYWAKRIELKADQHDRNEAVAAIRKLAGLDAAPAEGSTRP